jgi:hypothetical protein
MNAIHQPSFEARLTEKTTDAINAKSNEYFDLYEKTKTWVSKVTELDFRNKEYVNASSSRKVGWCFLLCVLLPITAAFDYSSVAGFLHYLSASAGGLVGIFIGFVGWLFFVMLELAVGWLIVYYAKDKPIIKIIGIIIAVGLIITPSFLIATTYFMSTHSEQLLFKTIALIIMSLIIHAIFFIVISEIWNGIFYVIYCTRRRLMMGKNPQNRMKTLKHSLQDDYTTFTRYAVSLPVVQQVQLLTNLAWYIKAKITNSRTPYDLSDFDPKINYAPAIPARTGSSHNTTAQ